MRSKLDTGELELLVVDHLNPRRNLIVPNVSWGFDLRYEADLVYLTRANYAYEIELKVSRSDLKADSKKYGLAHNHRRFKGLWFAMPESVYDPQLVPDRAGVMLAWRDEVSGLWAIEVERKPKLRTEVEPLTDAEVIKLLRLNTFRVWSLKRVVDRLRNKEK